MGVVNDPPTLGYIKFLTGPMAGNAYPITRPITTLGREPDNDIVISDPAVSRHHAQILWSNGAWSIRKLAPQNKVSINQREIQQSPLTEREHKLPAANRYQCQCTPGFPTAFQLE